MKREWVWAIVSLLIAILLSYILLSLAQDDARSATKDGKVECMDETERERIRNIVIGGIDKGLEAQIMLLFEVWMKDPGDQPRRAMVGTNNAFNAHVRARRQALAWEPSIC